MKKNHDHTHNLSAESSAAVNKAARLAESGEVDKAFKLLAVLNNPTDEVYNARGVCLMRLGKTDEAVRVFRSFVLQSGCVWVKSNLPVIYRTNYAASLLLAGLTGGAVSTLNEINQEDHPSVVRLRGAIREWEKYLSWWQWLNWKTGVVPEEPVVLTFPPGDFFDPLAMPPDVNENGVPFARPVTQAT